MKKILFTDEQQETMKRMRLDNKTYPEIAEAVGGGVTPKQVERYLVPLGLGGRVKLEQYKLGGSPQDREIVRLRDELERVNKELRAAHRKDLDEDEIRKHLRVLGDTVAAPPQWLVKAEASKAEFEVPVAIFADWHGGETVSRTETNGVNEYNVEVMKRRVQKLVERIVRLTKKHNSQYLGLVLALLGDFVSGGLHPELAKTDEIESIGAVLVVRDLLVWAIGQLADEFGQVYIPCTAGNHGRNTLKPEFKRYVYKNFDWMLYKLLEKHFENDPRIHFDIRDSNEVFFKVLNKRFLAMHGDMMGVRGGDGIIGAIGPIMRGEIKVRGSAVSSVNDYDILLIGHWHQPLWLPRVIVSNTLKGYDEFAKNVLRAPPTLPSQPLFFVHPVYGVTSRWEIYLEGSKAAKTAKTGKKSSWVSVFDPTVTS